MLVTPGSPAHNDNHLRLPALFESYGWQVTVHPHRDVQAVDGTIMVAGTPAADYQLIWPVGFGPAGLAMDLFQLLKRLPGDILLTRPDAYSTLHGKAAWLELGPPTLMSSSVCELAAHVRRGRGPWVLKPNAGSLGRDVYRVSDADQVRDIVAAHGVRYWLLQPYVAAVADGEYRTLVCADTVIGTYKRVPGQGTANLAQGGTAVTAELPPHHNKIVQAAMRRLKEHGVGFAAIDTVGDYLMEVNLANPGGLGTLAQLLGKAKYRALTDKLMQAINARYLRRSEESTP